MNSSKGAAHRDGGIRTTDESVDAIVCDLAAIPSDQRAGHIALARELFGDSRSVRELEDGIEVVLPMDCLRGAATFIEHERLCCRHLAFSIVVPSQATTFALRVTGSGAADELRALLR